MSTASIPIVTTTQQADTSATANSLAMRDSSGGLTVNALTATGLSVGGNYAGAVVAKTTSFTAANATDYLIDCTSGAVTVTLPLASASANVVYYFMKKDSSGNAVTISGVSGTGTLSSQYATVRVFSDGAAWYSH